MKYLIDTCVLSELRRPEPNSGVVSFMRDTRQHQWLSVMTIGELLLGAIAMPVGRRQEELLSWIDGLKTEYLSRILDLDLETAERWGELSGSLRRRGVQLAIADGLIAATALQHGLHIVTRNVKDFEPTGVSIVNPWEDASSL